MMNLTDNYNSIPEKIVEKLNTSNLFYSKEYYDNVLYRGQNQIYVWNDYFCQAIRVKRVAFLQAGVLESEPVHLIDEGSEIEFLTDMVNSLKRIGVQWIECSATSRFKSYPIGASVIPYGNHIVDLKLTEEELFKNVHSKHRNSIRRGEKAGCNLEIGHSELLMDYVKLSVDMHERSGLKCERYDYYSKLISMLNNESCVCIVYVNDVPQAGAIFYYNSSVAYYLLGASKSNPEPGAANYLLWHAMLFFKEKGVKEFSFVGYNYNATAGGKIDGIQRFKERFGGRLEQSYKFKYINNKSIYRLYGIARQIIARKPFVKYKDTIDEFAYKYPELNKQ